MSKVSALRDAGGDAEAIKQVIAPVDASFADALDADEISQVTDGLE